MDTDRFRVPAGKGKIRLEDYDPSDTAGLDSKKEGRRRLEEGIERLRGAETDMVFVLGHPGYYSRFGFEPAGRLGAPYPIPEKDADAWMAWDLRGDLRGVAMGEVRCAEAIDRPEYWRE